MQKRTEILNIVPLVLLAVGIISAGCSRDRETQKAYAMQQAREYAAGKNYSAAIIVLKNLIQSAPNSFQAAEAYFMLADYYEKSGDIKNSVHALIKTIQLDPQNHEAGFLLAEILFRGRRYEDALKCLNSSMSSGDNSLKARFLKVRLLAASGQLETALGEMENIVRDAPQDSLYRVMLANLYLENGETDNGLAEVKLALELDPKSVPAFLIKGSLLWRKNDPAGAETAFREALKFAPDLAVACNNLAWLILEKGGNLDEALALAGKATAKLPKNIKMCDTLGWIYCKKGLYAEAIRTLESCQAEAGKYAPEVFYHLGIAYYMHGDKEKAAKTLRQYIGFVPDTVPEVAEAKAILASSGS